MVAFPIVLCGKAFLRSCAVGILSTCLVFAAASNAEAAKRKKSQAQVDSSKFAAMVVDANTGKTLYAKNEDARRFPASVTKVMTLYLLFEALEKGRVKLDTPLRVSNHSASMPPSKIHVRAGSTIDVEDAIRALVTKSANDVAATVAENLAGSEAAFAQRMTRKARALGMRNTVYRNASGLPNPHQVTTARDLIILSRAIQDRFPRYYRYFSTHAFDYNGKTYGNHNRLLGSVTGVDGIKTGYTRASGFNLTTSIRLNGRHVVAVVLGGRTGAQRDAIMRQLLTLHVPKAYAGGRIAPRVAEIADDSDDAPINVMRTQNAAADEGIDPIVTASVTPQNSDQQDAIRQPAQKITDRLEPLKTVAEKPSSRVMATKVPSAPAAQQVAFVQERAAPEKAAREKVPETQKNNVAARISEAVARRNVDEEMPKKSTASVSGSSGWIIQIAAAPTEKDAQALLSKARSAQPRALASARPFTESVKRGSSTLYRARFAGFDREGAESACRSLKQSDYGCMVMSN